MAAPMKKERVPYRKLTWVTGVSRHLRVYPKLDPGKSCVEAKQDLGKYLRLRREKEYRVRTSVTEWRRAQYADTVGFWRVAILHVAVSRGVNWVVRARCSGIWTMNHQVQPRGRPRDPSA
jgi:hypothetical protein